MSFSYFDRVYVVHLPNPDRRKKIEVQLAGVGIGSATYIHAAPPPKDFTMSNMRRGGRGELGANLSHIKAVVHAIADGAERPLFLEDDIEFREGASVRLGVALTALPLDWGVLYLGGHPRSKVKQEGNSLVKVGTFSFAESYAMSRKALLAFFDMWCDLVTQPDAMYDFILGKFAAENNGYCVYPLLTDQPPGKSQISGKWDDKSGLVEKCWLRNLAGVSLT